MFSMDGVEFDRFEITALLSFHVKTEVKMSLFTFLNDGSGLTTMT